MACCHNTMAEAHNFDCEKKKARVSMLNKDEVDSFIKNLETQVKEQIETWTRNQVPSIGNLPHAQRPNKCRSYADAPRQVHDLFTQGIISILEDQQRKTKHTTSATTESVSETEAGAEAKSEAEAEAEAAGEAAGEAVGEAEVKEAETEAEAAGEAAGVEVHPPPVPVQART